MSFSINSKIFDIEDQDEINSLLSFLELNGKFTNGQICFKDLQQEQKYDKFRQLFSSLKQLYPEFQLRFTNSQNERNQIGSQITGPLIRANEQSINYDKSQTIQNQPYLSQNEHEENQNIQYYELNSSLIEQESQDSKMSIDDNLPQTVHSLQQIGLSQVQEIKNNHSQNDYQKINEQQSIKLEFEKISLQQIDSQFIILSLLDKDLANKTNDNYIIIHRLNQTERIPLQDNVILKMIEKIFFQEWKELINQLNLEYKRIDLYELKENNDVNQVLQQIQNFINKISYVDIEFCFYTNYTMMVQSKINAFLKSLKIHPFQYIDQFHLVSNMQNLTVLQEIRQQLNNNYRGILLYFSNLRPYKQENNLHLDLQFCRSQYYEKILVAQFKQFCINQFFNNEYFFLEMNFSHIIEYRELFEKEIKKYIQLCLASPFLLKFNFQCDQNDEIFIEKCFKEEIDNNQEKIIYLKKENSYLLFGITEVLIEILHKIMVTQIQKKTYLNKTVIHIVKQNLIHKYSGQHKFLNYDSLYKLLAKMGFNNQQIKGKDLIFNHFGTLDFQTLLQTLIMICRIRQQTLNQKKIQSIYQKLCSNKNIDYLNRFEDELFSLPLEGCSKGQKEQFTLTINILPTTINYFSIQKFILLKPKFLDSIIYDHLYQEFNDELVQKNSQIQFIKIEEGKYLLSCQSSQTVGQFENYFSQFQSQKVILNEDVLRVFELSRYKKLEFQKKNIYYKVDSGGLNLISKDKKALLNTFQTLEHYKPFILSMHSLKKQNLEENLENYSLVQARTGYIKYILGNILKQFFEDLEIELKEEQEISAYSIFHLNFSKYQQQIID